MDPVDTIRLELAARYGTVEAAIDAAIADVVAQIQARGTIGRLRLTLAQLVAMVDRSGVGLDEAARQWMVGRLADVYRIGAESTGARWTRQAIDVAAVTTIGEGTLQQLRAATRFLRRDVRRFRLDALVAGDEGRAAETPRQAVAATRPLIERGVRAVRYSNGTRQPIGAYADMLLRTTTVQARNIGALNALAGTGVGWVEVHDGPACGWNYHDDPDIANGTLRTVADALEHLLSHPNCQRSFVARPDVKAQETAQRSTMATLAERRRAATAGRARVQAERAVTVRARRAEQRRQQHLRARMAVNRTRRRV